MEECNRVLSSKLLNAEQSDRENQTKLDILSLELEKIEATRKEVSKNIFDKEVFFFFSFSDTVRWHYILAFVFIKFNLTSFLKEQ